MHVFILNSATDSINFLRALHQQAADCVAREVWETASKTKHALNKEVSEPVVMI